MSDHQGIFSLEKVEAGDFFFFFFRREGPGQLTPRVTAKTNCKELNLDQIPYLFTCLPFPPDFRAHKKRDCFSSWLYPS